MAATGTPTTNLGLRCPLGTDPASVDDINYNSGVIDEKMGAVGNTSVQAQLDALSGKFGGTKIFAISKTITVPAGDSTTPGHVTVDFSSDIGSASIWLAFASLGSSALPYVSNAGAVKTWIRTVGGSPTQQVTIYNTDSAWSNYTAYFVLICK